MNRRRLLTRIVQGFAVVGGGFAIYPFVKAWLPDFRDDLGLEVDLADLAPGQWKLVHWLGRKVIVRRRSAAMVNYLEADQADLKDPNSRESVQPAFADNPFRSRTPEYFVAFNNCTHLGCEVTPVNNDGVGFECPCHKSDYDYAGRTMGGGPAPFNLEVPWYRLIAARRLKLDVRES